MAKKKQPSNVAVRSHKKPGAAKKAHIMAPKTKSEAMDPDPLPGGGAKVPSKSKNGTAVRKKAVKPPPKTPEQIHAAKKALAMWGLLSQGGQASGGKLKPRIDPAERIALAQAGLLEVVKVGRALRLTVTDKGWDWAERNLNAPLPENVSGAAILQSWLTRLRAFLRARDYRLSEFFAAPDDTEMPPDHAELRERIRSAYCEVGGGFNRRVLLRDLRKKLADVDRARVDFVLMEMLRDEQASLMQLDYRPDVSDEDRAAALQIGSEPRHIIWISK